jgi:hypothetical protein
MMFVVGCYICFSSIATLDIECSIRTEWQHHLHTIQSGTLVLDLENFDKVYEAMISTVLLT